MLRTFVIALASLFLTTFSHAADPEKEAATKLVAYVDALTLPINPTLLGEDFEGALQDEPSIRISAATKASHPAFKGGLNASLLGPKERPVAVVFWVGAPSIDTYYIPFPGIKEVDRPRRLTKLGDRFYRLESNRSSKGVKVEKLLP
jgi:hypothetical protein